MTIIPELVNSHTTRMFVKTVNRKLYFIDVIKVQKNPANGEISLFLTFSVEKLQYSTKILGVVMQVNLLENGSEHCDHLLFSFMPHRSSEQYERRRLATLVRTDFIHSTSHRHCWWRRRVVRSDASCVLRIGLKQTIDTQQGIMGLISLSMHNENSQTNPTINWFVYPRTANQSNKINKAVLDLTYKIQK